MNLRPFQIVLFGIFGAFALFGIIFFMAYNGGSSDGERGYGESVLIWGTLDNEAFDAVIGEISGSDRNFHVVDYVEKDERTFNSELLNAIAEGRAPDLLVIGSDEIAREREKLIAIPYESISERAFRDRYVDGAEIFLFDEGIYGLPFAVDPLVMYWNRDLFSGSGLSSAPKTWEELLGSTVDAVTRVDESLDIIVSGLAFGEYANIRNAKEILSMLFLQAGSSIVTESSKNYKITLRESTTTSLPPAETALSFYTQFASPSSAHYSWNRSEEDDRVQFLGGTLAIYMGFGSEHKELEVGNPNLNFDIAEVPQGSTTSIKRNFGKFYAFAIPRASDNREGAFAAAQVLATENVSRRLNELLSLAPVDRATIGAGTGDADRQILYRSALIARGWLDPNPAESENVFRLMIEDVTSGRMRVSESIQDAIERLSLLF